MRKVLSILILATVLLYAMPVMSQQKVVVIPLGGAKNYMYWQGDWSVDTLYKVGDAVHVDGVVFHHKNQGFFFHNYLGSRSG